jgi:Spy/CpxP family protein refolding chaperone
MGKLAFPRRSQSDGDAKMKKTLVILASLVAFGTVGVSAASAEKIIIKRGGGYHHHHMMGHHHGGKTVIIKRGHRHY